MTECSLVPQNTVTRGSGFEKAPCEMGQRLQTTIEQRLMLASSAAGISLVLPWLSRSVHNISYPPSRQIKRTTALLLAANISSFLTG